jgi:hypothetical protein
VWYQTHNYTPAPRRGRGVYCFTSVRPSKIFFVAFFSATIDGRNLIFGHKLHIGMPFCGKRFWDPYILIFRRIFLSKYWWQKWEAFLDPSNSYFLFTDLVGFYTPLTYMLIFRSIFLSNYWWQESDIWSQASYMTPYRGKRFWTHQIPTSCLPTWLVFIHIEHICGGIISEH